MERSDVAIAEAPVWREVDEGHPCPCCGAAERCQVAHEGGFVRCFGQESGRPLEEGGYLHVLGVCDCHNAAD